VVPRRDEAQQRALAELVTLTPLDICLLAVDGAETSTKFAAESWRNAGRAWRTFPRRWSASRGPKAAFGDPGDGEREGRSDWAAVRLLDRHLAGWSRRHLCKGSCGRGKRC